MNVLSKKLIDALVRALVPRILGEVVKLIEEIVKQDLDKDGTVGFGG